MACRIHYFFLFRNLTPALHRHAITLIFFASLVQYIKIKGVISIPDKINTTIIPALDHMLRIPGNFNYLNYLRSIHLYPFLIRHSLLQLPRP